MLIYKKGQKKKTSIGTNLCQHLQFGIKERPQTTTAIRVDH